MTINSGKIQKNLGRVLSAPKRILKPFALIKHQMHRHECDTTFYLIQKIKQGFFLCYISSKENKCQKILKL
jgi:hypothetical protein